jgi:hypothetical protein
LAQLQPQPQQPQDPLVQQPQPQLQNQPLPQPLNQPLPQLPRRMAATLPLPRYTGRQCLSSWMNILRINCVTLGLNAANTRTYFRAHLDEEIAAEELLVADPNDRTLELLETFLRNRLAADLGQRNGARTALIRRKINLKEDLDKVKSEIRSLLAVGGVIEDLDKVAYLYQMVDEATHSVVYARNPPTFAAFFTILQDLKQRKYGANINVKDTHLDEPNDSIGKLLAALKESKKETEVIKEPESEMDKITRMFGEMQAHLTTQISLATQQAQPSLNQYPRQYPQRSQQYPPRNQQYPFRNQPQYPPRSQSQYFGAIKCFQCNQEGHISRECPNPCQNCGGRNHLGQKCPQFNQPQYNQSRAPPQVQTQVQPAVSHQAHLAERIQLEEAYAGKRTRFETEGDVPLVRNTRSKATHIPLAAARMEEDVIPIQIQPVQMAPPQVQKRQPAQMPLTKGMAPYSIAEDLQSMKANITVGQLLTAAPQVRRELQSKMSTRKPRIQEGLVAQQNSSPLSTLQIPVKVNQVSTLAICDTGSTISIISMAFLKQTGFEITRPCHYQVLAVDGTHSRPLGLIDSLPISFGQMTVSIPVAVVDDVHYNLLLGNDFLLKSQAVVDFTNGTVQLGSGADVRIVRATTHKKQSQIPVTVSPYTEEDEDSEEEEYEDPPIQVEHVFTSTSTSTKKKTVPDCEKCGKPLHGYSNKWDETITNCQDKNCGAPIFFGWNGVNPEDEEDYIDWRTQEFYHDPNYRISTPDYSSWGDPADWKQSNEEPSDSEWLKPNTPAEERKLLAIQHTARGPRGYPWGFYGPGTECNHQPHYSPSSECISCKVDTMQGRFPPKNDAGEIMDYGPKKPKKQPKKRLTPKTESVFLNEEVVIDPWTYQQVPLPKIKPQFSYLFEAAEGQHWTIPHTYIPIHSCSSQQTWILNTTSNPLVLEEGTLLGAMISNPTVIAISEVGQELDPYLSENVSPSEPEGPTETSCALKIENLHEIKIGSQLSEDETRQVKQLLARNLDVFAADRTDMGRTNVTTHRINTGDHDPIRQRFYRTSYAEKDFIKKEIDWMMKNNLIQPSYSPWSSPIVLVKKKNGEIRFCVDYRKLNAVTKQDSYPLPKMDEILEAFGSSTHFSTLDALSGFHQVEMEEFSREKTCFTSSHGNYEWKVMPFGLTNAPAEFQRLMDTIFRGVLWQFVLVYIDDVVIFSDSFEKHLKHLDQAFSKLRKAGIKLKPAKCNILAEELPLLGHIITRNGITVQESQVIKILNHPIPRTVTEIKSFMGLVTYYAIYIPKLADIATPMRNLTKKNVPMIWSRECQQAFDKIKTILTNPPILARPKRGVPFIVRTDASGTGLGAILAQNDDKGNERVIAYSSRTLTPAEKNYSTTDKEYLAVVWAVTVKYPHHLRQQDFTVYTDHLPLLSIIKSKEPGQGRQARWFAKIQGFRMSVKYTKGKINHVADALSRMPDEGIQRPPSRFQKPKTLPRISEETVSFNQGRKQPAQSSLSAKKYPKSCLKKTPGQPRAHSV